MADKKGGYLRPTATSRVSADYDNHRYGRRPPSREPGTDYACAYGSALKAPGNGKIIRTDHSAEGAEGRRISIGLDDGQMISMIHLSRLLIPYGTKVSRGQIVGLSGASAWGRDWGVGAHVHVTLFPTHSHTYGTANTLDFEKFIGADNDIAAAVQWVKDVQNTLNRWFKAGLVVDGIMGNNTEREIREAQTFLQKKGLYKGRIDGKWGPLTNTALNAYAKSQSKPASVAYHRGTVADLATLSQVVGLQKLANLYLPTGQKTRLDNQFGAKSRRGLQLFLNQNYGGSLPAWLRRKHGYSGNDNWGPNMKAAAVRAESANRRALK